MKLDKLEIHGFKSFADRTNIRFNPGITAVVGPNGCGKTNITDAIRWVLGEQRPTALRGSNMQEVIFNGSRERMPLGMAEVTLSFSNALGLIPLDYAEVAITRRVFRDGESHYFINKSACHLKDIRDLFMGTGVGSSAYSLIEQRMVDAILSDKAEERRFLFEEAAGVTRYKARRKATLRKLEATEADLVRLGDILNEVRKTTGSLRRQVGKARRFEELQAEEVRLAVGLARGELAELASEETPLRETIRSVEEELAGGSARTSAREAELAELERAIAGRRAGERELRQQVEQGGAALESLERERVLAEEGGRQAASEIERLESEIAERLAEARDLRGRREGMAQVLESSSGAAGTARSEVEARTAIVAGLTARFEAAQADLRTARAACERIAEERLETQSQLARALGERQAAALRRAELEAVLAAGGSPRGEGDPGLPAGEEELAHRVESRRTALEAAEEELRGRADERAETARKLAELEASLAEQVVRRRETGARLETLEAVKHGFAGFGEGARRALESRHTIGPGLRGPLALEVEVAEERYVAAIEAYLDLFLDALLTPAREEAMAVLEFWRERNQAGAVWSLPDSAPSSAPQIDEAAREMLLCRGTDAAGLKGDLDRHREALFGRLLLARDLPRATELRRRLNGNGSAGWYVVATLDGEILEPSGLVRLPRPKGDGERLSRFHQAEHLKAQLAEIAENERQLAARAGSLRDRLTGAVEQEGVARSRVAERAAELDLAGRELERLREAQRSAARREAELFHELAALEEWLTGEAAAAAAASERAVEVQRRLERAEAEQAARESELEDLREERDAGLRELGRAELATQERAAALAALEREERYLADAEGEQERLAGAKATELERQRSRIGFLQSEGERLTAAADKGRLELKELRQALQAQEEEIQRLEALRVTGDAGARAARRGQDEARQRLHVEEMRLSDLLHRRQSIRSLLETEFGRPLERLEESLGAALPKVEDLDSLREELRGVRERKSALGPVNLLALEEFGAEKDRLDFLEAQYSDLVRARDGLRQAIRKINATARELFVTTFAQTRQNFQATFGTLFEGGRADISLADEADPLESEIEISASPRGKRVQAVNLLSGGERALTALALLFAIYLVKPSPFCILDEVDAPLDDANIGRFLGMLRSFSDRIQFIIVTHNKRTMEAADFLYGVTMQEAGVSTLVSVDFERRHSFDYDAISFRPESAGQAGRLEAAREPALVGG